MRARTYAPVEIPTASMADVAFLLLVFFMVAATFASTRGLDFAFPPEAPVREIEPIESVLIEVGAGGGLTVDGQEMLLGGLIPYLEPILAADRAKPVILKTDPAAPYGAMVDVLDELRLGEQRRGLAPIPVAIPTEREIRQYWPVDAR
jgi:biopolymer transport protein ExbD